MPRMTLFHYLNDGALLIFSRKFRFLYEAAPLDTYSAFLAGASFPTPEEVVHAITVSSRERPSFLPRATTLAKACLT